MNIETAAEAIYLVVAKSWILSTFPTPWKDLAPYERELWLNAARAATAPDPPQETG